jgi:hypothetical protein
MERLRGFDRRWLRRAGLHVQAQAPEFEGSEAGLHVQAPAPEHEGAEAGLHVQARGPTTFGTAAGCRIRRSCGAAQLLYRFL